MNRNEHLNGVCQDYTYDGLGLVRDGSGFCVFVKEMLRGESGEIVVTKDKRRYAYGRWLKLEETSPHRVTPSCPIYKACGGCQLQHMDTVEQAWFKQHLVQQDLDAIGGLDVTARPIITMTEPYHYRNKMQLPVGRDGQGQGVVGFYRYNTHDIVPVDRCLLQDPAADGILSDLRAAIARRGLWDVVRHIVIKSMPATAQAMVALVLWHEDDRIGGLADEVMARQSQVRSFVTCVNEADTNVVWGHDEHVVRGEGYIEDVLLGCRFMISAHSFYQVNTAQTAVLYKTALDMAGLRPDDELIDLYCGVGTIGIIAARQVRHVIGVELVAAAVADAQANARRNGLSNIEFKCADAKTAARQLADDGIRPNVVVVDPPRKGCAPDVLEAIEDMAPDRLVYVSCNPATLARDLATMKGKGYRIDVVQPVDMFPQTYHVECVVLMSRAKE